MQVTADLYDEAGLNDVLTGASAVLWCESSFGAQRDGALSKLIENALLTFDADAVLDAGEAHARCPSDPSASPGAEPRASVAFLSESHRSLARDRPWATSRATHTALHVCYCASLAPQVEWVGPLRSCVKGQLS